MGINAEWRSLLDPANNEGYGSARLPCARDEEIAGIVRQIDGPEEFDQVKRGLGHVHAVVLAAFAERMASWSVRSGSEESLRDGLRAQQLALTLAIDKRDALPVSSLLFRASEILGLDPAIEFAAAAAVAPSPDAQLLTDFLSHDPEDQSIDVMGYVEQRDDDGFRFERTW